MTKQEFSKKILRCSYGLWRAVLAGNRNLSIGKAQLASQVLVTSPDVWIDPLRVKDRQEAWEKFNEPEAQK